MRAVCLSIACVSESSLFGNFNFDPIVNHKMYHLEFSINFFFFVRKVMDIISAQEHNKDLHEQFNHQVGMCSCFA